jgi:hypothetical protein
MAGTAHPPMILARGPEGPYLERAGERVPLSESEAALFLRLNPMGRKVRFGRLAARWASKPESEAAAGILLRWSKLPPREWRS